MDNTSNLIGLLGGTFDPIHNGHLAIGEAAHQQLNLLEVQYIPNHQSPHKTLPFATGSQRLAMIKLAIKDMAYFKVNSIELDRAETSFTIDTLRELKHQHSDQSLCLIIGSDSLLTLNTWKDYQEILNIAHITVADRPNYPLPQKPWLEQLIHSRKTTSKSDLHHKEAGCLYFLDTQQHTHSSTGIRKKLHANYAIEGLIPDKVIQYIASHAVY